MPRPATYLGPVIHHVEDDYGPLDVVDESDGKLRSLHFGTSARQSTMFVARPDDLALEYTRCMLTALLYLPTDPARALMLGLGGGSLVKFLLRWCSGCHVDVAELRSSVVEVAQQFFDLPAAHERLCIHLGDGNDFVQQAPAQPWDLLLLDLHTSDGMAPIVTAPEFLAACRRHMADDGVLAANLWYGVDRVVERRVRQLLEDNFARVLYLPVAGKLNCIALALPSPPALSATELMSRAEAWQARTGVPLPELYAQLRRRNPC